jgi:hypothetical protein
MDVLNPLLYNNQYQSDINMNDNEIKDIVPRDVLAREGTSAVINLAGGIFLLVLAFGAKFGILGMVLSVAALVIGIGALLSKDREDKKPGMIITAAGVMGMLIRFGIPVLKPFAGFLLGLGAMGLFAAGIWKGIKFLRGLKSRQ